VDVTIAPLSVDVDIELGDGRTVVGTVPGVVGDVVRAATYSRVGPRQRLGSWVQLLAVTAGHPGRSFTAITAGRGRQRGAGTASIGPLGEDAPVRERTARAHLQVLVDLYARGMCEPLPLYSKTSAAYATSTPGSRLGRARSEWESNKWENEDRDPAHLLVLGGPVPFDELLLASPGDGESGLGWDEGEVSRFGRLALRLWAGLLGVERRYNL
jgi:exodeoxyribonuclease V gamma subunit